MTGAAWKRARSAHGFDLALGLGGLLLVARLLRQRGRAVRALGKGEVRLCVITGAASGIGRATVLRLEQLGWHILAADFDEPRLRELDGVTSSRVAIAVCDVTCAEACERLRQHAEDLAASLGAKGVAALANVAGLIQSCPSTAVSDEQLRRVLAVNCEAPVRLTRLLMPLLLQAERPTLCNVASITADVPFPWLGCYSATKGFVANFSDSLRREALANGLPLRVSVVKPGYIETPMTTKVTEVQLQWAEQHADHAFAPAQRASAARNTFISQNGRLPGALGKVLAFLGDPKRTLANPPEDVATDIAHAICSNSPRVYYCTATPAFALLILLARWLPPRLGDLLLQNL